MIPAGLHLVTYGTGMERVGVFLQFGAGAGSMVEIAGWRCPCGHAPHERPSRGLLRVLPLSPGGAAAQPERSEPGRSALVAGHWRASRACALGLPHLVALRTSSLSLFGPPGDVHVLQWDPSTEMLVLAAAADAEHAAAAVRRGELDSSLGPYPLKTHDEWVSLSRHVDEAVLRRAGLQCGTFVLAGGIDDDEEP